MPNCVIAARSRLRPDPSTPQNSRTSATPMSVLHVRPFPSKRACCISRAASTRCRIAFECSPSRSSECLSFGS